MQRCPPGIKPYIANLKQIVLAVFEIRAPKVSFKFLKKNLILNIFASYKMQMYAWIKLKLGTQNGNIKANLCINFGANL